MGRRTGSPEMGAVLRHILSQKYISAPAACGNMVFYQTSASCIIQMIFFFQVNPRILHNPQTAPQGISFFKKGSYPFPRFHISFFRDHASVISAVRSLRFKICLSSASFTTVAQTGAVVSNPTAARTNIISFSSSAFFKASSGL